MKTRVKTRHESVAIIQIDGVKKINDSNEVKKPVMKE
jgi:hypothetical protein